MFTYSITHNKLGTSTTIKGNSIAHAFSLAGISNAEWKINFIEFTR